MDSFNGAVEHCLSQYEGNHHPPSKRVPSSFYRKNETCIRLFFTTADYTDTAVGAAKAMDIILINGPQIAQFLVYHKVGLSDRDCATINHPQLMTCAVTLVPISLR